MGSISNNINKNIDNVLFFFHKRTQQNTKRSIHESTSHRYWLLQRFNRIVCAHTCCIGVPGHLNYNLVL